MAEEETDWHCQPKFTDKTDILVWEVQAPNKCIYGITSVPPWTDDVKLAWKI